MNTLNNLNLTCGGCHYPVLQIPSMNTRRAKLKRVAHCGQTITHQVLHQTTKNIHIYNIIDQNVNMSIPNWTCLSKYYCSSRGTLDVQRPKLVEVFLHAHLGITHKTPLHATSKHSGLPCQAVRQEFICTTCLHLHLQFTFCYTREWR
jgi:hypothetical protein